MTISPNEDTEKTAQGLALISPLEQHKYLFETLWNKAIPADQKIKEIEGVIPSFIDTIADPNGIQKTIFDPIQTADHEILITFPIANSFHRQERLEVIKLLEPSVKRSAAIRILTPVSDRIKYVTLKFLEEGHEEVEKGSQKQQIENRYLEQSLQTKITALALADSYTGNYYSICSQRVKFQLEDMYYIYSSSIWIRIYGAATGI